MRKYILVWLVTAGVLWLPLRALAASPEIILFERPDCANCQREKAFLEELAGSQSFTLIRHDLTTEAGRAAWASYQTSHNLTAAVAPVTIINDQVIIGYNQDSDSGQQIRQALAGMAVTGGPGETCPDTGNVCAPTARSVTLPFIGSVDLNQWSLLTVTAAVGLADGYNPCAMWSLVALLSFLVALGSRRKMLLIGGSFLLTSFLASFLYLLGWHGLFNWAFGWQQLANGPWFIPLTKGLLGGLSLIMAVRLFNEWRRPVEDCPVTDQRTRSKIVRALQRVAEHQSLYWAVLGAAGLALLVNVIEFLCSLGLPVVFSSVLADRAVPTTQAVGYIALYNLFYMADDLIVFIVGLLTTKLWFNTGRGARWLKLAVAGLLVWAAASFILPLFI